MKRVSIASAGCALALGCASRDRSTTAENTLGPSVHQSTIVSSTPAPASTGASDTGAPPDVTAGVNSTEADLQRHLPGTAPRPGVEGMGSPAGATSSSGTSGTGSQSARDTLNDPALAHPLEAVQPAAPQGSGVLDPNNPGPIRPSGVQSSTNRVDRGISGQTGANASSPGTGQNRTSNTSQTR